MIPEKIQAIVLFSALTALVIAAWIEALTGTYPPKQPPEH